MVPSASLPSGSSAQAPGLSRVRFVHSFEELAETPFADGINALCWQRTLPGDFAEVVARLGRSEGVLTLDSAVLHALPLSAAGQLAVAGMLADVDRLGARDLAPV